jgi:hypothetical protein
VEVHADTITQFDIWVSHTHSRSVLDVYYAVLHYITFSLLILPIYKDIDRDGVDVGHTPCLIVIKGFTGSLPLVLALSHDSMGIEPFCALYPLPRI